MKKVLSVAMASAMVLGMGANAFAIEYSTGSNDTANWPTDFKFAGSLFVTDKDGDIITSAITDYEGKNRLDFQPGDTIWMPLYADGQRVYELKGNTSSTSSVDARTEYLKAVTANPSNGSVVVDVAGNIQNFLYEDSKSAVVYYYNKNNKTTAENLANANSTANKTWRVQEVAANAISLVNYENGRYNAVNMNKLSDYQDTTTTAGQPDLNGVYTEVQVAANILTIATANGNKFETTGNDAVKVIVKTDAGKAVVVPETRVVKNDASVTVTLDAAQVKELGLVDENAQKHYVYEDTVDVTFTVTENTSVKAHDAALVAKEYNVSAGTSTTEWKSTVAVKVNLPAIKGTDADLGIIVGGNKDTAEAVYKDDYNYTGKIDKNWSINLIEKDGKASELIEKAELYKADEVDYLSYKDHTDQIVPNGVYLKVTLKEDWKTADTANLKYYVYVSNNKNNADKTNEVWVSGKYAPTYRTVDFTWSNNANEAGLWKAEENGTAVFDFADKAFFTVKMYKGETLYLDLNTAYNKILEGEYDAEFDSFFNFDKTNANFAREGELVIVSGDDNLVVYEVDEEEGVLNPIDAEYVKDYKIAHTSAKVNGFKFNTKQLGNYVLSEELAEEEEVEEEEPTEEPEVEEPEVEEPEVNEVPETNKPNPETGAEDFVGLAVSLAVVSVAAAGALALKK